MSRTASTAHVRAVEEAAVRGGVFKRGSFEIVSASEQRGTRSTGYGPDTRPIRI